MKSKPSSSNTRRAEFETLYDRHHREVWAAAYSRWLDADLALDIAHEAFLRLWKHWETDGEEIANARAWLMTVARNLAEDCSKSAFRKNGTSPIVAMNGVQSRETPPVEHLERLEAFANIRATLESLPQSDRDVLTLRYALEYDVSKIAETLGITPTAVHMRLSRARQKLADRLSSSGTTTIP